MHDSAATIPLTKGQHAIVDAADFERLNAYKWTASARGGAFKAVRRRRVGEPGTGRYVYMHRDLMGAAEGAEVDHANRNPLDNRRDNLRLATRSQNGANRAAWRTSLPKGVHVAGVGRWVARIRVNGRQLHLGTFSSPEAAAKAYDAAAEAAWGSFACKNFAGEGQ